MLPFSNPLLSSCKDPSMSLRAGFAPKKWQKSDCYHIDGSLQDDKSGIDKDKKWQHPIPLFLNTLSWKDLPINSFIEISIKMIVWQVLPG